MTEKSDPYENAIAERINGILKDEFDLGRTFQNILEANNVVQESITLYNNKRPHSSISYLTPDKAHTENAGLTKTLENIPEKRLSMETTQDKYFSINKSPPCKVSSGL
jgi:transposase InsO family protein